MRNIQTYTTDKIDDISLLGPCLVINHQLIEFIRDDLTIYYEFNRPSIFRNIKYITQGISFKLDFSRGELVQVTFDMPSFIDNNIQHYSIRKTAHTDDTWELLKY